MEKAESALRMENLTTGFRSGGKEYMVSRCLNAQLFAGRVTALVGTNGTGKSTLLRTLSGLCQPLGGNVYWQGQLLDHIPLQERSRCLAVVLTQRVSGEGLTVRDVVEMGRMPYTGFDGRLSSLDKEEVEKAFMLTGTQDLQYRAMNALSDGERQRVLIAKALAQGTSIILLDEPTAFLDFPSKVSVLQLLCKLSEKQNKTILLSTHDLELTFQLVEHLWLLSQDGLTEGTPLELANHGYLDRFFSTQGITFDRHHLRFMIQK